MPLFMDVHHIDGGVTMDDVAQAHLADLRTQGAHDVQYLKYWVDEARGRSSAWLTPRPPRPRRRCTRRPTAWSPIIFPRAGGQD